MDEKCRHGAMEAATGVEMAPRTDEGVEPNSGEGKARPRGESPLAGGETSDDGMASSSAGNGPMSVPGNERNEQCGEGAGVQGDGKEESGEGKGESKGWWWIDWGSNFGFMGVEDRTAAQEQEEADQNFVMGFLETEVFQGCMDQQTMLARESLRVEGYRSIEELRNSNLSIASLLAKGVPIPHARSVFGALQISSEGDGDNESGGDAGRPGGGRERRAPRVDRKVQGMCRCEVDEELKGWLEERGCCGEEVITELEERGLSCFQALWTMSQQDMLQVGIPQHDAELLVQHVASLQRAEEEFLASKSLPQGAHQNVSEATAALAQGIRSGLQEAMGTWREGKGFLLGTTQLATAVGAGAAQCSRIISSGVSHQAGDIIAADLGLCFDEEMIADAYDVSRCEGECINSAVCKFSSSGSEGGFVTAISDPLKPGYSIQSFEFWVKALSEVGILRLGIIEANRAARVAVEGDYAVGDCDSSWALSSAGLIVHRGSRMGPQLPTHCHIKSGDRVRVLLHEKSGMMRFAINCKPVGTVMRYCSASQETPGLVAALSLSNDAKALVVLRNYWSI